MKKKKKISETTMNILQIILFSTLLFCYLIYVNVYQKNNEKVKDLNMVKVLDDYNRHTTVTNCIRKYLDVKMTKNTENILLLLDDRYEQDNGIDANNVLKSFPSLSDDYHYDYISQEIKYKRVSKDVVEYYVSGYLTQGQLDTLSSFIEMPFTIIFYENKLIFTVRPGEGYEN